MLNSDDLFNIICTEAIEYGGLQEVPDHKHGALQHYHSLKRDARAAEQRGDADEEDELPPIQFAVELIRHADGRYEWVE